MSFFGGGRSSAPAAPASQTTFVREAPGIEERKIELMDIARQVAQKPIDLPDIQAAGPSALEQLGFQQAAQTGVGAGTSEGSATTLTGAFGDIVYLNFSFAANSTDGAGSFNRTCRVQIGSAFRDIILQCNAV